MRTISTPSGERQHLYSPKEAGKMLSISEWLVRTHIRNGLIKAVRWPGRRLGIEAQEIERFAHEIMGRN